MIMGERVKFAQRFHEANPTGPVPRLRLPSGHFEAPSGRIFSAKSKGCHVMIQLGGFQLSKSSLC